MLPEIILVAFGMMDNTISEKCPCVYCQKEITRRQILNWSATKLFLDKGGSAFLTWVKQINRRDNTVNYTVYCWCWVTAVVAATLELPN
jgi:hypothetical protein